MRQNSVAKKTVKICCDGETKRLKITGDYSELINRTRESFNKQSMSDSDFKFFYVDNENEVISITGQEDLTEALNIEDLSAIKLTVASNIAEATKILYEQMQESKSIACSINQSMVSLANAGDSSQHKSSARGRAHSDFDQFAVHGMINRA